MNANNSPGLSITNNKRNVQEFVTASLVFNAVVYTVTFLSLFFVAKLLGPQQTISVLSSVEGAVVASVMCFVVSMLITQLWRNPGLRLFGLLYAVVLSSSFMLYQIPTGLTSLAIEFIRAAV